LVADYAHVFKPKNIDGRVLSTVIVILTLANAQSPSNGALGTLLLTYLSFSIILCKYSLQSVFALSSSLVVRRTRLSTVFDRAFPVAASGLWNTAAERHDGAVSDYTSGIV